MYTIDSITAYFGWSRVAILRRMTNGICSGCRTSSQKGEVDWDGRRKQFEKLIENYRSKDRSNYDCLIPVSGGKDSYFQIHIIKTLYGLNPMAGVVEGFRWALVGTHTAPGAMILVSAFAATAILISGAYYFRRMEKTFADVV